ISRPAARRPRPAGAARVLRARGTAGRARGTRRVRRRAGRTASGAGLARRLDLRPPLGLGLGLVGLGGLVRLAVLVLGALVLGVVALGEVDAVVAVLVVLVVVVEVLGLFVLDDLHDGLLDEANLDAVGDLENDAVVVHVHDG